MLLEGNECVELEQKRGFIPSFFHSFICIRVKQVDRPQWDDEATC